MCVNFRHLPKYVYFNHKLLPVACLWVELQAEQESRGGEDLALDLRSIGVLALSYERARMCLGRVPPLLFALPDSSA